MKTNYKYQRTLAISKRKSELDKIEQKANLLSAEGLRNLQGDADPTPEVLDFLENVKIHEQTIEQLDQTIQKYTALSTRLDEIEQKAADHKLTQQVLSDTGIELPGTSFSDYPPPPPKPPSKPFSELWENYKAFKTSDGTWKTQTPSQLSKLREYDAQFKDFLEVIDGDMPASGFTEEHAQIMLSGLLSFPKNRRKNNAIAHLPLEQIPQSAEKISVSTASQRLDTLKGFFRYLKRRKHVSINQLEDYQIDRDSKNFATPTQADIKEWFNLPEELISHSWQFWIPRIALFTGARQNEVAQLYSSDIHRDSDSGIWCMTIHDDGERSTKNKSSNRIIPIPQVLIDNGFLELYKQVAAAGHKELWPNLKAKRGKKGTNVSGYWTDLKQKHGVLTTPLDPLGRNKTFHSLRRVLINQLDEKEIEMTVIQSIVGHEPSLGTTKRYLDRHCSLGRMKRAIDCLKVEDISWNHPLKYSM